MFKEIEILDDKIENEDEEVIRMWIVGKVVGLMV